jgi:hypothetical protein
LAKYFTPCVNATNNGPEVYLPIDNLQERAVGKYKCQVPPRLDFGFWN